MIHAMILAAGRGSRMGALTQHQPKPLLPVRGQALIDWHLVRLRRAGMQKILVNTAWLAPQLHAHLAADRQIVFSDERQALETAGGVMRVLSQLADPFWLIAADAFAPNFDFSVAPLSQPENAGADAWLYLVPNPPFHPNGDFGLSSPYTPDLPAQVSPLKPQQPQAAALPTLATLGIFRALTFSGIGLYRQRFFQRLCPHIPQGNPDGIVQALGPLLQSGAAAGVLGGEIFTDYWADVGTPERLAEVNRDLP